MVLHPEEGRPCLQKYWKIYPFTVNQPCLFSSIITSQHVASFLSWRLASKKVGQADKSEDEEDEHAGELNKIHEQNIQKYYGHIT